jgi:peroxiredoxin Q/BCP
MANPTLNPGDSAPAFDALTDGGGKVTLSELAGKRVILYFYPKDNTPGCTTQACDFRDNLARLQSAGFEVLGVSPDSAASHDRFKAKYELTFPLLVDSDHSIAEAFGVWREKKNYGRTYMGIVRSTFVIDAEGKLEKIYDNCRAKGHVERLLKELA